MALPFDLEHAHTIIVTRCEIIEGRMSCKDPISICISSSLMDLSSAIQIPKSECFILWIREQNFKSWMENNTRYVVSMGFQSVHFPMLISRKSPQLDSFIICSRCDNSHSWVKRDPIDTSLVALKNVLNLNFSSTKYFIWSWSLLLHTFLFEPRKVPYSHSLIQWSTCNQSVVRMESSTHYVMTMPSQNCNNTPILPIPESNRLVITARDNPRKLLMELDSSNIIQMAL